MSGELKFTTTNPSYTDDEVRLEKQKPDDYRLGMKPNGALVLQGYFTWLTSTGGGGEWRDLPTVALDE